MQEDLFLIYLKEMDQYQPSSQQNQNQDDKCEDFQPKRKKLSKNQQIYGDFYEAYEPEPAPPVYTQHNSYSKFKAGATIETYSSDIEVTLPISKPKGKQSNKMMEEEQDDKPMLGQFSLNSFLDQLGGNQLDDIEQEIDQNQSQALPQGLNQKILKQLQLYRLGQEQVQEPEDVHSMTFQKYMQMGKPKQQPKYKTQEEKQAASQFNANYGVGFKMMEKLGFKNITKGLGKDQTGINKPVQANFKTAFTMKDDSQHHKKKKQKNSESEEQLQKQQNQLSIAQQLFKYRSKTPKINNFLLDLQQKYQKINSQMYFLQSEITSIKTKHEITLSTQAQQKNQIKGLREQMSKLQIIGNDLDRCIEYPHLGQHYQIDLLFVKKVFDRFRGSDFEYLCGNAEKEIMKLKSALYKFYLAKSKESLKLFEETSAIEKKMHINLNKKHKKKDKVIDLDNLSEDDVQIMEIGLQEQEKIKKFIDFLINKTVLPQVQDILSSVDSLDRVKDLRVVDLLEVIKKFDNKDKIIGKIVQSRLIPLYDNYIRKLRLDDFQTQKVKVLPHHIILPWLNLLRVSPKFTLNRLYRALATKLWNLQNITLFNIVTPLLRFSSSKDINFFTNLCLAPRLLYLLQTFSISTPNPTLLNGFIKYSQLLPSHLKAQLLESTLFMQVQQVYSKYIKQKQPKQVMKWLKGWRQFSDKISPKKFQQFFHEIINNQ